jgi:8-oxo-dGTP pyrophosphatase MutT (NUDIX family)
VSAEFIDYWHRVLANRDAEVVLAIEMPDGCFLVHTKGEYPPGLYRFCSGGVKRDESVVGATRRELVEETGLNGEIVRFLGVLRSRFRSGGEALGFTSYLFHVRLAAGRPAPVDDSEGIIGYRFLALGEVQALARELASQPPGFWSDWGRFRAVAHRVTFDMLSRPNG